MTNLAPAHAMPYQIAVLCYLYDPAKRLLLLRRNKMPNKDFFSPIGGKLEITTGESPHQCAVREIDEETGISLQPNDVELRGIISEESYENTNHWLIFLYEVKRHIEPDEIKDYEMDEGTLEWVNYDKVAQSDIPETDRRILWPLIQEHQDGFFMAHVRCDGPELEWEVTESYINRPPQNDHK